MTKVTDRAMRNQISQMIKGAVGISQTTKGHYWGHFRQWSLARPELPILEKTHSIFLRYTDTNKPKLEFLLTKRKGLIPQQWH